MNKHSLKIAQAIAGSWLRSFVAATVACYMSGITDPSLLLKAGLAAVLPVANRYLNPKDPLGR
jgi:Na+/serine symporter